MSEAFTILGCGVEDDDTATTTETCDLPTPVPRAVGQSRRDYARQVLSERATCNVPLLDVLIYIKNPTADMFWLRQRLEIDSQPHGNTPAQHDGATEIRSDANGYTAFFYVKQASEAYLQTLFRQPTYQVIPPQSSCCGRRT